MKKSAEEISVGSTTKYPKRGINLGLKLFKKVPPCLIKQTILWYLLHEERVLNDYTEYMHLKILMSNLPPRPNFKTCITHETLRTIF